ncbi:MAG: PIG-L family deacetylase [Acidobacteria bacterium]|nr:PIG-L family deacetylase [Acidobacteriota bacterium]
MNIVIAGGHPGDPEYGCGGTAARYALAGHRVTMLYLNRGEKSCPASADDPGSRVRVAEARAAAGILGASVLFADQCDGRAVIDNARYDSFRRVLESARPDVIFTQWPIDNHPDHRAVSALALDAWFAMGRKPAFYYYEVSNGEDTLLFQPTDYVDITQVESKKRSACYAHASQSPDRYWELQSRIARFRGLEKGCGVAEGFIRQTQSAPGVLP